MPAYSPKNSEANLVAQEVWANALVVTATSNLGLGAGWSGVRAVKFQLVAASVTGTTPSYAIKLQDSSDGVNWVDVASAVFTAITAAGAQSLLLNPTLLNDNVRVNIAVTGTTPSAAISLTSVSIAHSNIPA